MDKAIKEFHRQSPEYLRLLSGHRVMMKNFPKWKDEFDTRMTLDMYTTAKDIKLLPRSFVDDELAWMSALQSRLESLNFNMNFLHEQRQLLEKAHKEMERLFGIFNKTQKFMILKDLPTFEPQKYIVPEIPEIVPQPDDDEDESNNFDAPANLTFVQDVVTFAQSALNDFAKAKEDIERFTMQMSDAKKSICAANAANDQDRRFGNLQKYRKAEEGLHRTRDRMVTIAERSRLVVEKILHDKIENCEWEFDRLSRLVDEYDEMRFN